MKRILLVISCLIIFMQTVISQNYIHEFGKFSNEEFQLQRYAKDPSAEAVVIYDIGKSHFIQDDNGFQVVFERTMKIKIFNKAGLKWAQIAVRYYQENNKYERITELKGNTYNYENGQVRVTALDPKIAFNEKYNEHWYDRKFAMPDVKEGSVIEVSYTIVSPYLFNFRNWEFQNEIPVIYSEYTALMIPFYEYVNILQGVSRIDNFKSYETSSSSSPFGSINYKDIAYCYVMREMPAFKDEAFISSVDDYIIKIDFQLSALHHPDGTAQPIMTTWPKLSNDMIDDSSFGKYLNSSKKKGKEIIDTMQIALLSTTEKAKKIERFVKTNFNWNGNNDKFASKSVKDFISSKTGNCADINLFLTGMLNAAGIDAYPVIISTRKNGKIKVDYPFLRFFNYVIVLAKIDSLSLLLDATEPLSNFSEIPSKCINDKGLIIQKNKIEWMNIKSTSRSDISYKFDLNLNADKDSISQICKLISTGYEAINYRGKFLNSYKELKIKLMGNNSLPADSLKPIDLNRIEKPFEIDFISKVPVESIEDKIIISPFCNFTITENPLKQLVRTYPIDLVYRESYNFQATIAKPSGYKLITQPEDLVINNNLIKITFVVNTKNSNEIIVIGGYEFKKDVYGSSDYAELKNYFNRIVDKFNEKLVFVKGDVKI